VSILSVSHLGWCPLSLSLSCWVFLSLSIRQVMLRSNCFQGFFICRARLLVLCAWGPWWLWQEAFASGHRRCLLREPRQAPALIGLKGVEDNVHRDVCMASPRRTVCNWGKKWISAVFVRAELTSRSILFFKSVEVEGSRSKYFLKVVLPWWPSTGVLVCILYFMRLVITNLKPTPAGCKSWCGEHENVLLSICRKLVYSV
jgi:hypothetical protein